MFEAADCLGGNSYVEEAPLARFYREAPVNSIWEGSGNVTCLDVLRSMQKQPESVAVLLSEMRAGAAGDRHLVVFVDAIEKQLAETNGIEQRARRIVEMAALALQTSLMAQHAAPAARRRLLAFACRRQLGTRLRYPAQGRVLRRDHRAQPARPMGPSLQNRRPGSAF